MAGHSGAHSNHGNTPAAWTAVTLIFIGSTIAGVAVVMAAIPVFVVGCAVIAVGCLAGKVMSVMAKSRRSELAG
jgi:hypothetical protein